MPQRSRYWSCTKFADWLRATAKPKALTMEDWDTWHEEAKSKHSFRYWLAEKALDRVQNFFHIPTDFLYSVKYKLANRFVTKTHALTSNLKKWQWHELDTRMLHCMFDELVDFVEVDVAWCNVAWDKETRAKYNMPFYGVGWFRTRTWRCPEAGLDYLKWAMELVDEDGKPTQQAQSSRTIIELYTWWKDVRPQRKPSEQVSGWSEYCNQMEQGGGGLGKKRSPAEQKKVRAMLKQMDKIDSTYYNEDTKMLIELVRVRSHLWT